MGYLFSGKSKYLILIIAVVVGIILAVGILGRGWLANFFYQQGREAFSQTNWAKAASNFEKANFLMPDQPEYVAHLAYAYHRQHDQRAEKFYQKALSMNYQSHLFYASVGWFYEKEKKDNEQAIDYYKKAINLKPARYTFAYERLINLLLFLNRPAEAVPIAEKLLLVKPDAKSFGLVALVYSRNNRFEEAEASIKKAIELEPNNPVWQIKLGRIVLSENKVSQAIKQLEKSIKSTPLVNEEALCTLVYIYTELKPDYQKAISYGEKVIKKEKEGGNVNKRWLLTCLYNLGNAYLKTNHLKDARNAFERFISLSEDPSIAYNGKEEYIQNAKSKLEEISQ